MRTSTPLHLRALDTQAHFFRAAVVVLCAGFLFFRVEQNAVQRSLKNAAHVSDSNSKLKAKNAELADAKKQLEEDEEA